MNKVEVVIMLNGNHCVITIDKSKVGEFAKFITDAIHQSNTNPAYFMNCEGYHIIAKNVLGFYVRKPYVDPTKEVLQMIKDEMDDLKGGDEWKGQD